MKRKTSKDQTPLSPGDFAEKARADVAVYDRILCWLPASVVTLMATGLVLIYSASAIRAERMGVWSLHFIEKQLIWIVVGTVVLLAVSLLDYRKLLYWRWPILLLGLGGLWSVLVAGAVVNGARRWFRFGGFSLQPSELAKFLIVIALAGILSRLGEEKIRTLRGLLFVTLLALLPAGLIAVEPDMGTAALLSAVLLGMIFLSGARIHHLAGIGLLFFPFALYLLASRFAHVMGRINAFFEGGREGKAYHAFMSMQSIRSGGLTGTGPGSGWAKLFYLPEAHTDFIFSVLGQEWGLVGTIFVTLAFMLIVSCGFMLFSRCQDLFGSLLAFGLTMVIGLQALFNIAVVTGSVPTKGISLPFVSFGGSGLICNLAMIGLLISIARVKRRECLTPLLVSEPTEDPASRVRTYTSRPAILAVTRQAEV